MSQTVLAVLIDQPGAAECLEAAGLAAAALKTPRVVALHVRRDPDSTIIPSEEILTPKQRRMLALEEEGRAAALHAAFADWSARRPAGLDAAWLDVSGLTGETVARHGAAAALVVMAAPGDHPTGQAAEAFHAALFETHRLLLRVPHPGPVRPPHRIAIGWKDHAVCRAAIERALPWLRAADAVDLLHVAARDPAELAAGEALLRSHGITATPRALTRGEAPVGTQVLAEAAAWGADWLLIGAFRRPQAVEWLLGGVTRTVLHQARLPVLMLH